MNVLKFIITFFIKSMIMNSVKSEIKKKTTLAYLRAVQIARQSVAAAILLFFILHLFVFSFLGSVITGILILPMDYEDKIKILFYVLFGIFILILVALKILLSEKTWFKASGAEKMLEDL
jgi:hypothetical protein